MNSDIAHLLGKREIFWGLQEIAQENPQILKYGWLFDWMCANYVSAATMSVRGFVDVRSDVRSLGRMLYEMLQHPGVINRRAHRSLYRGTPKLEYLDLADLTFDGIVGKGSEVLSQRQIRSDLRGLEDSTRRVVIFTHKKIAHRAKVGELRKLPLFNELDAAMDCIDRIFCKYNCLLTASGMSSTFATRQYNWMEVLYEAWIKLGSKFHPGS